MIGHLQGSYIDNTIQVAALAPLALLLLLEARCDHLVVAHLINIMLWSIACQTAPVIALGTVVPMSKMEDSLI